MNHKQHKVKPTKIDMRRRSRMSIDREEFVKERRTQISMPGLPNSGTDCYCNAVVQMMVACKPMMDEYSAQIMMDFIKNDDGFTPELPVLRALVRVFNDMKRGKTSYGVPQLRDAVWKKPSMQDADDFYETLIFKVRKEILEFIKSRGLPQYDNFDPLSRCAEFVTKEYVTCVECGTKSTPESVRQCEFMLEDDSSFDAAMAHFRESISVKKCPKCEGELISRRSFTQFSNVFICRSRLPSERIQHHIDLRAFADPIETLHRNWPTTTPIRVPTGKYELRATINHLGSFSSGHYTTTMFENGRAVLFNDDYAACDGDVDSRWKRPMLVYVCDGY